MQRSRQKDPAAVVKFYTDDGVLLPQGAPLAEGHDAITKVWRGYFDLPDFSLTFSPTKIDVSSSRDLAYEIGVYALSVRGDKGPVHEKGKYVVVWKILQVDGIVDHRDVFFSDEEKAENAKLCTCVSRVAGANITVDTADRLS